jgi:hypothetical protein
MPHVTRDSSNPVRPERSENFDNLAERGEYEFEAEQAVGLIGNEQPPGIAWFATPANSRSKRLK